MIRHFAASLGFVFIGLTLTATGCASMANPGDAADADASDTGSDVSFGDTSNFDVPFVCPADPSTLIGQPCHGENVTCGHCSDPCSFCNLVQCVSGSWSQVEVFPGPCDAGTDVAVDATPTPCGTTSCTAGQVCVHTQAGGGPCRQPEDGGCGPGETFTGACCVYHQDWYRCDVLPAACNPSVTCGCAQTLCEAEAGPPSCPCSTADTSHVECGCFYP